MNENDTLEASVPAGLDDDFGGDFEQQMKAAREARAAKALRTPTFGTEGKGKRLWNVMVRHSTFLLKQADIWARSPEEAQKLFLEQAHEQHKTVAARQKGPERDKAAKRVLDAYQHGIQHQHDVEWIIRPTEEVRALRRWLKDRETAAVQRNKQLAKV